MIEVRSYFRVDGQFVLADDLQGDVPDTDYVEGAITVDVDGVPFIDFEHWDLVDQLWSYISEALLTLKQGQDASIFFPDQPLELSFKQVEKGRVKVVLHTQPKGRTIVVDKTELMSSFSKAGLHFLELMGRLSPGAKSAYDEGVENFSRL
ncbi:hypothetical protein [Lysobacter enzymogenes]|uniref:Uncharacterized protein n=1 Tax=Lysobacter enzymogenes TaxID=69 RepID=A0AAU9AFI6_LYSEN|nr:hypothetical protein [Lysobacter enzymogenes]BAV96932.1 conserved hypothetical protein [Lysobacter enzymogenes]